MTVLERTAGRIEFDSVRIDPNGHRLFVAGNEVRLEPKAFAVLVLLASRANCVVGRDEILDTVWGHRHVTPAVLSRVIAMLRRALGENADARRWINTVHGVGYRLDVPFDLRQPESGQLNPGESDRAEHTIPHLVLSPVPDAVVAQNSAIAGVASVSGQQRRWLTWTGFAAAVAALGFALALYSSHRTPAKPATHLPKLAILPFTTVGDDAELRASAEGLAESLIDQFSRAEQVRTIGRDSTFALARSSIDVQKIATQLDSDYMLRGDIAPKENALELHASLWRRGQTTPVWTIAQATPRGQLFLLQKPLADRLRDSLATTGTEPVQTISAAAQNLYWLGRHEWQRRTSETLVRALDYFQRAAAEDPHYALAWCGISDTYMLLFDYADLTLDESVNGARAALNKAREIDPQLIDIDVSESAILAETDHQDEAVVSLEKALRASPEHPLATLWYGDKLEAAGRVRDAVEWYKNTAERDPYNVVFQNNFGVAYMLTGQSAQASERYKRSLELFPDYSDTYWNIALQYRMHGDLAQAMVTLINQQKGPGANSWTAINKAFVWLQMGDAQNAAEVIDSAPGVSVIDSLDVKIQALCLLGRCKEALQLVDAYHPQPADIDNYRLIHGKALALDSQLDAARAEYAKLFAEPSNESSRFIRLWKDDLNLAVYSTWAAVTKADSNERAEALATNHRLLDRLSANGVSLPLMTYRYAVLAALEADTDNAVRKLNAALDAGWLDASALDRDLAWKPYRDSQWLHAARLRIEGRVLEERTKMKSPAVSMHG